MSNPAAKQGDSVTGTDTHVLMIPSPGGPVPTPTSMPFQGKLDGELSSDVIVENKPAATAGSVATSTPHVPSGGPFQKQPANKGTVQTGRATVLVNNRPIARDGDPVLTCNDPADAPNGTIVASGSVLVG